MVVAKQNLCLSNEEVNIYLLPLTLHAASIFIFKS